MVDPKEKDKLLNLLCNNLEPERMFTMKYSSLIEETRIDKKFLTSTLRQFERMELLELQELSGGTVGIILSLEAFDLKRLGGFEAREEILKLNLQKLKLEIDSLTESFPDKADKITSIISNIASIVPTLFMAS